MRARDLLSIVVLLFAMLFIFNGCGGGGGGGDSTTESTLEGFIESENSQVDTFVSKMIVYESASNELIDEYEVLTDGIDMEAGSPEEMLDYLGESTVNSWLSQIDQFSTELIAIQQVHDEILI